MTDARWPSRWASDRRFARLPAEHVVSYAWALMYAVESGTDGRLEDADFDAIGRYKASSTEALIAAGLFGRDDQGFIRIIDYPTTQTTAAEVRAAEERRVRARVKKQTQRARPARESGSTVQPVPVDHEGAPVTVPDWPTVAIPDDEPF